MGFASEFCFDRHGTTQSEPISVSHRGWSAQMTKMMDLRAYRLRADEHMKRSNRQSSRHSKL